MEWFSIILWVERMRQLWVCGWLRGRWDIASSTQQPVNTPQHKLTPTTVQTWKSFKYFDPKKLFQICCRSHLRESDAAYPFSLEGASCCISRQRRERAHIKRQQDRPPPHSSSDNKVFCSESKKRKSRRNNVRVRVSRVIVQESRPTQKSGAKRVPKNMKV